jgi:hypothetical protein
MQTISIVLIVVVLFILINSLAHPNRWVCNVLLGVAIILWLVGAYGWPFK